MPPANRPIDQKSKLVDQHGRPMGSYLYPSPRLQQRQHKPRRWLSPSTKKNVNAGDRWEMVNYSRQLFAQVNELGAAVNSKNQWAFGDAWDAHYMGRNEKWGQEAENYLNTQWMPNCNVRGPLYGFKTSMLLSGISWDVDGDDVMVLTRTDAGFPQLAFYPATKIATDIKGGSPFLSPIEDVVKGGPFDGAKIFDGIIFDRASRVIGVRIFGDDDKWEDISAFNCDLSYEPQWVDQGRGFPKIATSLLRWMNLQDIDEFIQKGVKRAAAVGLIQKNEEGEAPTGNEIITEEVNETSQVSGSKVAYEEVEGGEVYYLSAPEGESIEGLKYENPHPNTEAFVQRVLRGCLASVGWYIELLDLGATGRAPTRVLCDMANQSVWSRQSTGYRRWKRAVNYAIALGMKSGYLSRNDDGADAYMMEPGLPKPISVDAGNEATADREALKLGLSTRQIISQKTHGLHWRAVDRQRQLEVKETIQAAVNLNKEFPQISFERALELLEQRSPNPAAQVQQQKPQQSANKQP